MTATSTAALADALRQADFRIKPWKETRVYIYGYGRDITLYIEPIPDQRRLADGAHITVETTWRSPHAGRHCKHIKHAFLTDLFRCGLRSEPPPEDWRAIPLDDRPRVAAFRITPAAEEEPPFAWPCFPPLV